jgi:hypothetical protein
MIANLQFFADTDVFYRDFKLIGIPITTPPLAVPIKFCERQ